MADHTPIEHKSQLVEWMLKGCKPASDWRIGTEHEKFGFHKDTLKPLEYEGDYGIRAMLEGLQAFGWQPVCEGDNVIALTRPPEQGGGSVTLEPGGQLELSGAPLETIHQTCAEVNRHLKEVQAVAEKLGQGYLGVGFSPLWGLDEAPRMPKGRYRLMRDYMPKQGQRGLDMMFLSSTVQVNLDFGSEADMVQKLRIGLALQPLATALFANSPFKENAITGNLSERSMTWLTLDPKRTGMLPRAFQDGFCFEDYVEYALDVPMYFIVRNGSFINALGMSFRDFLNRELPALPGELPTEKDWEDHLTTLFPEARVKRFIEMRGADSGPWGRICALPALWVGLLYDADTQRKVYELIADWTQEDREAMRAVAPIKGLATPFRDGTLRDLAEKVLNLADAGLQARNKSDGAGGNETIFLRPLKEVVASGKTPAEILIEKFDQEWGGDVRPIFKELAF